MFYFLAKWNRYVLRQITTQVSTYSAEGEKSWPRTLVSESKKMF